MKIGTIPISKKPSLAVKKASSILTIPKNESGSYTPVAR
jgi:hypothetical protein